MKSRIGVQNVINENDNNSSRPGQKIKSRIGLQNVQVDTEYIKNQKLDLAKNAMILNLPEGRLRDYYVSQHSTLKTPRDYKQAEELNEEIKAQSTINRISKNEYVSPKDIYDATVYAEKQHAQNSILLKNPSYLNKYGKDVASELTKIRPYYKLFKDENDFNANKDKYQHWFLPKDERDGIQSAINSIRNGTLLSKDARTAIYQHRGIFDYSYYLQHSPNPNAVIDFRSNKNPQYKQFKEKALKIKIKKDSGEKLSFQEQEILENYELFEFLKGQTRFETADITSKMLPAVKMYEDAIYQEPGTERTLDRLKLYAKTGLENYVQNVVDTGSIIASTISGNDEARNEELASRPPSAYQIASNAVRNYYQTNNLFVEKATQDAITSLAQNAIPLTFGLAAKGKALSKVLSSFAFAPDVFGGAYKEGLQSGIRDTSKLWQYALVSTASELTLEMLLGSSINPAGGVLSGEAISALGKNLNKVYQKAAVNFIGGLTGEFIEESTQSILSPILKEVFLRTDEKTIFDNPIESLSDAAYEGFIGLLSASPTVALSSYGQAENEITLRQKGSLYKNLVLQTNGNIKNIAQFLKEGFSNKTLKKAAEKIINGDTSDLAVGELVNAFMQYSAESSALVFKMIGNNIQSVPDGVKTMLETFEKSIEAGYIYSDSVMELYENVKRNFSSNDIEAAAIGEFAYYAEASAPKAKILGEVTEKIKEIQKQDLQSSAESGIINQETSGGDNNVISNQGAINGSGQERKTTATGKTAESQRITGEDSLSFQRRIESVLGQTRRIVSQNGTTLAFIPQKAGDTEGGKAYNILKNNGYSVVYCEGTIYRNNGKVTTVSNEALTAPNGTVYISSNATLQGIELALHESVHIAQNTNDEAFAEYESVLCECLDITSESYDSIAELINKNNFGGKYDIEDINSWKPIMKELSAYINQYVMTDIEHAEELFGGMFSDWNAVVEAVKKFNNDIGLDLTQATSENEAASFLPESDSQNGNLQSGAKDIALSNPDKRRHHTTKAEQDYIESICKALGRKVVFEHITTEKLKEIGEDTGGEIPDGYIDKKGVIHIGFVVGDPINFIFKHELTHFGEGTAEYEKFVKAVRGSSAYRTWLAEATDNPLHTELKKLEEAYLKIIRNGKGDNTEIIADFVGDCLFKDNGSGLEALVSSIEKSDRPAFIQYILDFLAYLKKKLAGRKDIIFEISRLEDSFNRMLSEATRADESGTRGQNKIKNTFAREHNAGLIAEAEKMEREGVSKDDIWYELGIIRDNGDVWVNEIDDSNMEFYPDGDALVKVDPDYKEFLKLDSKKIWSDKDADRYAELDDKLLIKYGYGDATLKNYLKHDELFKKYPQLKDFELDFVDLSKNDALGVCLWEQKKIILDNSLLKNNDNYYDLKSVLIHEIQHAIQNEDKREEGSSVEFWNARLLNGKRMPKNPKTNKDYSPEEAYYFTSGEIESRETERRLDYGPNARRYGYVPDFKKNMAVRISEYKNDTVVVPTNSEYSQAIKDNDINVLQQMVDTTAKANGYTEKLYHQTDADFTEFNTENQRAGKYDFELPTGTFLKPSNDDIGLKGKKQMELYAKLQNPLEFKDRQEVRSFWEKNVEGYAEAVEEISRIDEEYRAKTDEAIDRTRQYLKKWRRENPDTDSREIYKDPEYLRLNDLEDSIVDEWEETSNEASLKAKELINDFIAQNDYDGIIVEKDSDGGNRYTKTYIVFDSSQLKSAEAVTYDDNGEVIPLLERFQRDKKDIRYSFPTEGRTLFRMLEDGEISKEEYHYRIEALYEKALSEMEDKAMRGRIEAERYGSQLKKRIRRQNEQLARRRSEISQEITEQREERATRQKNIEHIRKTVNRIDKMFRTNSNTKHVPEELKEATGLFVKIFVDNDVSPFDKREIREIRTLYGDLIGDYNILTGEGETTVSGFDPQVIGNLRMLENRLNGKTLRDLNYLETLLIRDIVDNFWQIIKNENEMFIAGKQYEVDQIGIQALTELKKQKAKRENGLIRGIDSLIKYGNMTPVYFFDRIGGVFKKLFGDTVAAQEKWYRNVENAKTYIRQMKERFNYDKWDNDTFKFTTEKGDEIEVTREQSLLLYATAKREYGNKYQRAEHLFRGGVVIPPSKATIKSILKDYKSSDKKGVSKITDAMTKEIDSRSHRILPQDVRKIFDWLTKEQCDYADAMVDYLSKDMAALGNETSMQLYGIRKYNEDYYIPYNSAQNYLYSQPGVSNEARLKHQSFTKETVVGANNPLVLSDFSSVAADHINRMCMYNAFTIPLENMNKIFNYSTPATQDKEGRNVKVEIERVYGSAAVDYIKQFLLDMNGNARISDTDKALNRWISKFKKGAVFASASVVVQQPSAIMRAMAYINPKYFTKTLFTKRDYQEAVKYAAVAGIKEMGRFDTGTGITSTKWLLQQTPKGFKDKVKALSNFKDSSYRDDILSYAAAKADEITWAHIWAAVKAEVKDNTDLDPQSEEFFELCGERFTKVINHTQVYDSTLARSQMMRDKSASAQMLTSFMSEPTLSLNMMMDAAHQAKTGGGKGKLFATGAVAALIGNVVLNAALKSLVTAGRDDEEDKTYGDKYKSAFTDNVLSDILLLNYIPFVKDVISISKGYDIERAEMSLFSDLYQAIQGLDSETKSTYRKLEDFAGALSAFFGLPTKNVMRDIRSIYNASQDIFVNDKKDRAINNEVEGYIDEFSDNKTYNSLNEEEKEKLDKKINDTVRNVNEAKEDKKQMDKFDELYEVLRKYGNKNPKYKELRQKMLDEGLSSDDISNGVEIARIVYMKSQGVDVHEYLLYKKATSQKYADKDKSGGVNKSEKQEAIKRMDLSDDVKDYFLKYHK